MHAVISTWSWQRARLRLQAREWLKADLALRKRPLESGTSEARAKVQQLIAFWKVNRDLARVQNPALAQLPDYEQMAWRAVWAEAGALERQARGDRPRL